ncbi:transglutaminase-like cysteine peptidase [Desulfopila aestuarii]|uniref:Transglutaminase-like cysteine proteinase BTLCP n=1 Tax=Desulfopila aestuarii DSM 18488 TaxID=1121416 RepID=A0A1M7XVP8_9BACT|nr:transglutaminase-like cysteine peptidase [Desulfopila aestuarii]SHO42525.1 transglutaminase-like cysteine proteinase BTLCP [Desulfopila aestuarii DSM 18488]
MRVDFVLLLKHLCNVRCQFARFSLLFISLFFVLGIVQSKDIFTLPESLLQSVESQYGNPAKRRLLAWQALIRDDSATSDKEKMDNVNRFFNQLRFVNDKKLWGKSDYWATPVEFLSRGAGDCEDFALAKYFTLKALGVEEEKLNMTYVKALELNQAHMVVTYYAVPNAIPLVLDSLVSDIQPATSRKDLLPVYSFNGTGLWLAKARGKGQQVGGSDRLKRWQDLLSRMPEGLN